ncbi:unnamed protein product [Cylindrotheca closterium]|uniref:protein-serine/threonine phosphatase n=1 Tax=Cylindrotheca closterium TaxID=2856 RepID=A0AAD2FFC1_9STRA|nr:unnamed protein product [Cylindrotheca closterium]
MEDGVAAGKGITLIAKWGKERVVLENLDGETTVGAVKDLLAQRTGVLSKRQKLIGLKPKSSKLNDGVVLKDLKVKNANKKADTDNVVSHEFIMMGTKEENIFVDPNDKDDLPDVVDDFDLDFNAGSSEWLQHVANGDNLKKFTESTMIHVMSEPRPGKPLLVLDLDHTLLDFNSKALQRESSTQQVGTGSAVNMKRPHMDDFLTRAYRHYDLVVWSQTSWRWLETKLIELGMLTHPGYRFCFVMDKTSMFKVTSTKRSGAQVVHYVKPLQIIWSKFPQWGSHNTAHVDDLSRNFALNLGCGIKVTGFYRKRSKAGRDSELLGLAKYLEQLAEANVSFEKVKFGEWKDVVTESRSLVREDDSKEEE